LLELAGGAAEPFPLKDKTMSNMPMPSYNPEWSQQPIPAAPTKPTQVRWAFQLVIAAAALQVIAAIFGVVYVSSDKFRQSAAATIAKQNLPANAKANDLVQVAVTTTIGVLIATAVVAVALYIVIGLFINKGAGWARITGLVLAVISLSRLIGLTMPAGIFTVLQVLAGIAAIILCFSRPGSQYFTDSRNFRKAGKIG
jgi:hypothetical protein